MDKSALSLFTQNPTKKEVIKTNKLKMDNKRNPKSRENSKQNDQNTQRQADLSPLNNNNKI